MAENTDIAALMQTINISDSRGSKQKIDQLAASLSDKLQIGLDQDGYRQLAEKLVHLNLQGSEGETTRTTANQRSNAGGVSTISGEASDILSPNITARRGRSPARPLSGREQPKSESRKGPGRNLPRNRSPSPFGLYHHSKKPYEEKKELDNPRMGLSGRESPMLDPLAGPGATAHPRPGTTNPGSRSSSPYARPGLQEDDDQRQRIGGISPARSVAHSVFTVPDRPATPTYSRSQTIDDDDESTCKPAPPRSFSMSPRRGPDMSPGAASTGRATVRRSARRTHHTRGQLDSDPTLQHKTPSPVFLNPNLGMPDFSSASDPNDLLTPPPRFTNIRSNEQDGASEFKTAPGKYRRKEGPDQQPAFAPFARSNVPSGFPPGGVTAKPPHNPNPLSFAPVVNPPPSFPMPAATPFAPVARTPSQASTGANSPMDWDATATAEKEPNFFRDQQQTPQQLSHPPLQQQHRPAEGVGLFQLGVSSGRGKSRQTRRRQPGQQSSATVPPVAGGAHAMFPQTADPVISPKYHENANVDYSGISALIASRREEGKSMYMTGNYQASIHAFTEAIRAFRSFAGNLSGDTLAVLLSNRAAGWLMQGAFHAAVADCQEALSCVSPPLPDIPFSSDSGLLLKIKLFTRMARALIKLGEHQAASQAFQQAIQTANEASAFSERHHSDGARQQNQNTLSQMTTEAQLGSSDANRLRDTCDTVSRCSVQNMNRPTDKSSLLETLGHVNVALTMAPGSEKLAESKLSLLAGLKRWREVASFCERLAAHNVKWDSLFVGDLSVMNPYPDIPPARHLAGDFFGEARDEDALTAELKLNSRAAAEATLRLPFCLRSYYLRALRLEERYPATDSSLRSLDELVKRGTSLHNPQTLRSEFSWLIKERSKLDRTRMGRERGDELFRRGEFEQAASQYNTCLRVDEEGIPQPLGAERGDDAGGRLHAVLHCNRAACLMAVKRFHEAIDECTKALRIHSRYMKAMLRRARCYMRLQRFQEAVSEYKHYMELVSEVKGVPLSATSFVPPCLFDGPRDVTDSDLAQVTKELEDVHKAKQRADSAAREEAGRRRDRSRWQDAFPGASQWGQHQPNSSAHQRRDEWYNQQSEPRRWDSFASRGPRQGGHARSRSWNQGHRQPEGNQGSSGQRQAVGSPGSDASLDHYSVLSISINASEDEIKKAYRKMALKYHPDKNKSEGAADSFRRVKLAYETLNDATKRRRYDAERRFGGRMF